MTKVTKYVETDCLLVLHLQLRQTLGEYLQLPLCQEAEKHRRKWEGQGCFDSVKYINLNLRPYVLQEISRRVLPIHGLENPQSSQEQFDFFRQGHPRYMRHPELTQAYWTTC